MRKYNLPLFFFLFTLPLVHAQLNPDCMVGTAKNFLNTNDISARLMNNGVLFQNNDATDGYLVPKDKKTNAIVNTSLWVGGYINNELRMTGAKYSNFEFAPGPLDSNGNPLANCSNVNRIWKVSKEDLQSFDPKNPTAFKDISEWPWYYGAPVKDGDGNKNNYNLEGGDRPAIEGTQTLWWVMNDVANDHSSFKTKPLGLEVRVMAFAENNPNSLTQRTTFYRYTFINKGQETIKGLMAGFYIDSDLGMAGDDFVATDSTLNMVYTYNRDNEDEGTTGYGTSLPALGYVLLRGFNDQPNRSKMYSAWSPAKGNNLYTFSDAPQSAQQAYYKLMGKGNNGEPMRIGGTIQGQNTLTSAITRFQFPGAPPNYWTMDNTDGQNTAQPVTDMRMMFSTGQVSLAPNQTQTLIFAIHAAFANDRLLAVQQLKKEVQTLNSSFASTFFVANESKQTEVPVVSFTLSPHYPNPVSDMSTISFTLQHSASVTLSVFDILGREVKTLLHETRNIGQHSIQMPTSDLPNGLYLYRLTANGQSQTQRLIVQH
jgi:hypothetical protein